MLIFVGSKNPVKINSVINAGSETWPNLKVVGIDVPSGINEQPMTDEETQTGSNNRAKTVLTKGLKTLSKKEIKLNEQKKVLYNIL